MSTGEGDILCQVDKGTCFSTVVNDKSTVLIGRAQSHLNFLLFCWDWPLGHGFECQGIHLVFLTIDDMPQKYDLADMELAFEEVDCEFMLDLLVQYFLNYGLVFSFGIATIDKNIVEVPDPSFHVFEDCMHHFLK